MASVPEPDVRRWVGIAALTAAVALATESITKLTMGARPPLDDSGALVDFIQRTSTQTIIGWCSSRSRWSAMPSTRARLSTSGIWMPTPPRSGR